MYICMYVSTLNNQEIKNVYLLMSNTFRFHNYGEPNQCTLSCVCICIILTRKTTYSESHPEYKGSLADLKLLVFLQMGQPIKYKYNDNILKFASS